MNVHSAILLYWVRWKKVSLYVLGMDGVIDCQQKSVDSNQIQTWYNDGLFNIQFYVTIWNRTWDWISKDTREYIVTHIYCKKAVVKE